MLTLHHLEILEGAATAVLILAFAGGAIYLAAGMTRPEWVGHGSRRWVAAWTLGVWLASFALYLGVIAYTHSRADGPHTFKRYMQRYVAERCAQGAELPACHRSATAQTPD